MLSNKLLLVKNIKKWLTVIGFAEVTLKAPVILQRVNSERSLENLISMILQSHNCYSVRGFTVIGVLRCLMSKKNEFLKDL